MNFAFRIDGGSVTWRAGQAHAGGKKHRAKLEVKAVGRKKNGLARCNRDSPFTGPEAPWP
jgi:hypothetical protein